MKNNAAVPSGALAKRRVRNFIRRSFVACHLGRSKGQCGMNCGWWQTKGGSASPEDDAQRIAGGADKLTAEPHNVAANALGQRGPPSINSCSCINGALR